MLEYLKYYLMNMLAGMDEYGRFMPKLGKKILFFPSVLKLQFYRGSIRRDTPSGG